MTEGGEETNMEGRRMLENGRVRQGEGKGREAHKRERETEGPDEESFGCTHACEATAPGWRSKDEMEKSSATCHGRGGTLVVGVFR